MSEEKKQGLSAEELELLNSKVSSIFAGINLDSVTESSTGRDELSTGYYLCELESANVMLSSKNNLGAGLRFKTIQDGLLDKVDEATRITTFTTIARSKNKSVFKWYNLKDDNDAKKLISDVLKFTDEDGTPLIPKETFKDVNFEEINMLLEALQGIRIWMYVDVQVNESTGEKNTWYNLLSWTRAKQLELTE